MSLLWPEALLLYGLVPALVAVYLWMLRRPSQAPVRYSSLDLAGRAATAGGRWRRHVPASLYLLTLCGMIFTVARPVAPVPVPDNRTAIMLSIDVSGSMQEQDIAPSRIEAAKRAAAEFVRALPQGAKVGLVAFSTYATLVSPPTEDHDRVIRAISTLQPEFATAIGDGILKAVYALPGRRPATAPSGARGRTGTPADLPPAAVVLMSDGGNNSGTPPAQAVAVAQRLHVVVDTVGLGVPPNAYGDNGASSVEPLDEGTLQMIARITGGTYRRASSAIQLTRAYTSLGRAIGWTDRPEEVSGVVAIGVAVLLAGALAATMFQHRLG
jgi:Ca-activated chloride channel family protein